MLAMEKLRHGDPSVSGRRPCNVHGTHKSERRGGEGERRGRRKVVHEWILYWIWGRTRSPSIKLQGQGVLSTDLSLGVFQI